MMKAVCLLALAAVATIAQLTVNDLTSGATVTTSLPVTQGGYNTDLYRIYVPENATNVFINVGNLDNSACTYIDFYPRSQGLPCNPHYYDEDVYICANGDYNDVYDEDANTYNAYYYSSDLAEFELNNYIYVAVVREDYSDGVCQYNITATVTLGCPVGKVSVATGSATSNCYGYANATSGITYGASGSDDGSISLFKINVPQGTGNIHFVMNSTSNSPYVYGRSYSPSGEYDADCSLSGGSSIGNYYIYDLYCYTPRAGDFYFTVSSGSAYNATVVATLNVCGAGYGGYNCTFQAIPLNITGALATGVFPSQNVFIPYNSASSEEDFAYFYIDIPAGLVGPEVQLVGSTATTATGYMYVRREGWPRDDSTDGYEVSYEYSSFTSGSPATFYINQYDWQVPGRFVIGFECYSSGGCNFTLGFNYTAQPTTTTTTTTTGTGATTTTGTISGATSTSASSTSASSTSSKPTTSATSSTSSKSTSGSTTTGGNVSGSTTSSASFYAPCVVLAVIAALL